MIEDRPEGRILVVTGPWTAEAEEAVRRQDVDGVWLNYARGYCEPDLSFVDEWPIKRLLVLDRSVTDLEPLSRLGATLEELSFQVAPGTRVDRSTRHERRAGERSIRSNLFLRVGTGLVADEFDEVAERDVDVEDVQSERGVLQPGQRRPLIRGAGDA